MLTDADLATLRHALERRKAAELALEQGLTCKRLYEAHEARREAERVNAALLPGMLAEIAELRRLIRIYAPEQVP